MFNNKCYVWNKEKKLGRGATSIVCEGLNIKTGDAVAVKLFTNYYNETDREIEVWKNLDHVNIVKVLSIEDDPQSKAIVMELCSGGSLFDCLNRPENMYGFEDKDFLLFLRHLRDGLGYLRSKKVAHRDLKPGNIMKHVLSDGSTIYKLTDFGMARILEENQPFESIVGTAVYCHPDVYDQGMIKSSGNKFTSAIDLWSIGATLYHVATGSIPFRPHKSSEKFFEALFKITSNKKEGVISGVQVTPNSDHIEYRSELPNTCIMSSALQDLVTPLIASLLENNKNKTWDFNKFFTEISKIISMKSVLIFNISTLNTFSFYIKSDTNLSNLQNEIFLTTGISKENQLILQEDKLVTNIDEITETTSCPLFLFNKDPSVTEKIQFPKIEVSKTSSLANDYSLKRKIDQYNLNAKLIHKSVKKFVSFINSEYKELYKRAKHIQEKSKLLKLSLKVLDANDSKSLAFQFDSIYKQFEEQNFVSLCDLYQKYTINNEIKQTWDNLIDDQFILTTLSDASSKAKYCVYHCINYKCHPEIIDNNPYEKTKYELILKSFNELLSSKVIPSYQKLCVCLGDWYKSSNIALLKKEILTKDIDRFEKTLKNCIDEHIKNIEEYKRKTPALQESFTIVDKSTVSIDPSLLTKLVNGRREMYELCNANSDKLLSLLNEIKKHSKNM